MANSIVRANNICKSYPNNQAVDHLSIDLKYGECFALLGPNGAGKTTTCEILEGLITPDSGDIEIFGKTYTKDREYIYEHIGVQLQESNLYKKYTIHETFSLFASFYQNSVDIDELIESLALTHKKNTRLEQLSGGQRQRVYLGRALINQPNLLFLDEPSTGLDPHSRRHLWDFIGNYKNKQRGILLTTHFMEEAEYLADRVGIMDHGRLIAMGKPRDLIHQYCEGKETLKIKFNSPENNIEQLKSRLNWLNGSKLEGNQLSALVSSASEKIQDVFQISHKLGIQIESFSNKESNLEDVFLKLTGRNLQDV